MTAYRGAAPQGGTMAVLVRGGHGSPDIEVHCEFVRQLARRLCRGHIDHEDLAQDAIERWLRALPELAPSNNHRGWLTIVLRNLFIDRLRMRGTRREVGTDCARLLADDPEAPPWWSELRACDVDRELARLSRDQRTTFRLFAFEGKSYDEISRALGITRSTVGTRLLRARSRLKDLLGARRQDPRDPTAAVGASRGTPQPGDRRRPALALQRSRGWPRRPQGAIPVSSANSA
jgi:RNA polymerase sigma-70 factor (ECF subfamily)